jgi:hypothetical protein
MLGHMSFDLKCEGSAMESFSQQPKNKLDVLHNVERRSFGAWFDTIPGKLEDPQAVASAYANLAHAPSGDSYIRFVTLELSRGDCERLHSSYIQFIRSQAYLHYNLSLHYAAENDGEKIGGVCSGLTWDFLSSNQLPDRINQVLARQNLDLRLARQWFRSFYVPLGAIDVGYDKVLKDRSLRFCRDNCDPSFFRKIEFVDPAYAYDWLDRLKREMRGDNDCLREESIGHSTNVVFDLSSPQCR